MTSPSASHYVPPGTSMFGAEFQALLYAQRAGFSTEERSDTYVAFRDDIRYVEYHLCVTKPGQDGRYWWKRMRAQ